MARGTAKPDLLLSVDANSDTAEGASQADSILLVGWTELGPSWRTSRNQGTRDLIGEP